MNSKTILYSNLFALFLFNISIRYYEFLKNPEFTGIDSWDYLSEINTFLVNGNNRGFYHFLGYFGMLPPYQNSGIPIFIGNISLVIGVSPIYAVIAWNLSSLILLIFSSFIISTKITDNKKTAILLPLIISTSNYYVKSTLWTINLREYFILLVFVLLLLTLLSISRNKKIFLIIIFLTSMASIHKNIFFIPIILFPILLMSLINKYLLGLKIKHLDKIKVKLLLLSILSLFFIASYYQIFFKVDYLYGDSLNNNLLLDYVFQLIITYSKFIGVCFFMMPMGVLYLINNIKKPNYLTFFLIALTSTLFLPDTIYFRSYLISFFVILIYFGSILLLNFIPIKSRVVSFYIVFILIAGLSSIPLLIDRDIANYPDNYFSGDRYSTGFYIDEYSESNTFLYIGDGMNSEPIQVLSNINIINEWEFDYYEYKSPSYTLDIYLFLEERILFNSDFKSLDVSNYPYDSFENSNYLSHFDSAYVVTSEDYGFYSYSTPYKPLPSEIPDENIFIKTALKNNYVMYAGNNYSLTMVN